MKRHCSACGLPGHDRRRHNPEFFTVGSGRHRVVHPIRNSRGYDKDEDSFPFKKTGVKLGQFKSPSALSQRVVAKDREIQHKVVSLQEKRRPLEDKLRRTHDRTQLKRAQAEYRQIGQQIQRLEQSQARLRKAASGMRRH